MSIIRITINSSFYTPPIDQRNLTLVKEAVNQFYLLVCDNSRCCLGSSVFCCLLLPALGSSVFSCLLLPALGSSVFSCLLLSALGSSVFCCLLLPALGSSVFCCLLLPSAACSWVFGFLLPSAAFCCLLLGLRFSTVLRTRVESLKDIVSERSLDVGSFTLSCMKNLGSSNLSILADY